nr:hypothetical protein [Angustibacter aerolatus]
MTVVETETPAATRVWRPKQVLVTRSAAERPHGREIVARAEAAGVPRIEPAARRPAAVAARCDRARDVRERQVDARGRGGAAVQPAAAADPPSADWRFDLAEGCPAHCQYCYLAGSLGGPPVTRAYANLDEVLAGLDAEVGRGSVTTGSAARDHEGTTFEASCYTDPLGIERLTGSLSAAVRHFGTHDWAGPTQPAVHHQVRRRRAAARPAARGPDAGAPVGERRAGQPPVRGRHRLGAEPARRPAAAGPRGVPGRPDDRADHAGRRLAHPLRRACSPRPPTPSATCPAST